jgi:hypothetical protein
MAGPAATELLNIWLLQDKLGVAFDAGNKCLPSPYPEMRQVVTKIGEALWWSGQTERAAADDIRKLPDSEAQLDEVRRLLQSLRDGPRRSRDARQMM